MLEVNLRATLQHRHYNTETQQTCTMLHRRQYVAAFTERLALPERAGLTDLFVQAHVLTSPVWVPLTQTP